MQGIHHQRRAEVPNRSYRQSLRSSWRMPPGMLWHYLLQVGEQATPAGQEAASRERTLKVPLHVLI